jgi:hypothetical protein
VSTCCSTPRLSVWCLCSATLVASAIGEPRAARGLRQPNLHHAEQCLRSPSSKQRRATLYILDYPNSSCELSGVYSNALVQCTKASPRLWPSGAAHRNIVREQNKPEQACSTPHIITPLTHATPANRAQHCPPGINQRSLPVHCVSVPCTCSALFLPPIIWVATRYATEEVQ